MSAARRFYYEQTPGSEPAGMFTTHYKNGGMTQ
uniref:Uncharacterized protein n=1 Tax=Siphoviridae sp. ct0hG5 TaxID=2826269 RepID=A0A8S5QKG6_9CAUD|nr:MAG TPA: hypothetical protein [Siphoviridae sp. ct0hG5]DAN18555.1 MAG TPA: hypothetical protein [Caudoviricetes sp.]DAT66647.1 MAG TPA: hypothetical protein [Caudoviricetes sp.]DAZ66673.1 MAG TPA: hypothetical protein [Caudoviricetes sp.]